MSSSKADTEKGHNEGMDRGNRPQSAASNAAARLDERGLTTRFRDVSLKAVRAAKIFILTSNRWLLQLVALTYDRWRTEAVLWELTAVGVELSVPYDLFVTLWLVLVHGVPHEDERGPGEIRPSGLSVA